MTPQRYLGAIAAIVMSTAFGQAADLQREALVQNIELPGAGVTLVVVTAKAGGTVANFRNQPDPNLVYLAGGALVHAHTDFDKLLNGSEWTTPACRLDAERSDSKTQTPIAIYLVPKAETIPAATAR